MSIKHVKLMICLVLSLILGIGSVTMAYASNSDIVFLENIDPNVVKHMDNSILNDYLFKKAKAYETELYQELRKKCEYLDDFKINSASWDFSSGRVKVNCYGHFVYKKGFVKIKTHADIGLECNLVTSTDYSQLGIGYFNVSSLNINNCPGWLDKKIKEKISGKLPNEPVWFFGGQASMPYQVLGGEDFKNFVSKQVSDKLKQEGLNIFEKDLPYQLGKVIVNIGNMECNEFNLAQGQAKVSGKASLKIQQATGTITEYPLAQIDINLDFYIDQSDNKCVVKVDPNITLAIGDKTINDLVSQIIKQKLLEKGAYIKFLNS